jgi:hypothetical protein
MIDPVRRLVERYRYRVTGGECRLQRIIEQIVEADEFGLGTDEPRVPFCSQETLLPPFAVAMLGAAPRSISAAIASQPWLFGPKFPCQLDRPRNLPTLRIGQHSYGILRHRTQAHSGRSCSAM